MKGLKNIAQFCLLPNPNSILVRRLKTLLALTKNENLFTSILLKTVYHSQSKISYMAPLKLSRDKKELSYAYNSC